jgi:hypothetical protein
MTSEGLVRFFGTLPLKSAEPIGLSQAIDWLLGPDGRVSQTSLSHDADAFRRARCAAIQTQLATTHEELFARVQSIVTYLHMLDRLEAVAGLEAVRRAGAAKLHFVWRNAFDTIERRAMNGSLIFERAGLQFNLAAQLAHYAVHLDAGPQAAARALQIAAGCAARAQSYVVLLDPTGPALSMTGDMRPACLRALENLFLGQAQACFAERATTVSRAVQLKLWGQAAAFLRESVDGLPASAKQLRVQADVLAHICLARAHACAGECRRAERKFGVSISHLALAMQLLDKAALALKQPSQAALRAHVEVLRRPVAVDYEVAHRDNNQIYFEREVPVAELAHSIELKSMVRSLDLDSLAPLMDLVSRDDPRFTTLLGEWASVTDSEPPVVADAAHEPRAGDGSEGSEDTGVASAAAAAPGADGGETAATRPPDSNPT